MNCPKCGNVIQNDSKFCMHCGTKVVVERNPMGSTNGFFSKPGDLTNASSKQKMPDAPSAVPWKETPKKKNPKRTPLILGVSLSAVLVVAICAIWIALDGYKDSAVPPASVYDEHEIDDLKSVKVGDNVFFGTYEQDNNPSNGKEKIEWRVLDIQDGRALLISEYALDCKPYNTSFDNITWETCTLRTWLNNDFLNAAFSAEEKARIPTVTVSADLNPEYGTDPGNATEDKVFLLSIREADQYFTSNSDRQFELTAYAVAQDAYKNSNDAGDWLLRSPGRGQALSSCIFVFWDDFYYGNILSGDPGAVRPALWLILPS